MTEAGARKSGDLADAIVWLALGLAVVIGAWRMDRLEDQDINPYTIPGLLPGLLGVGMILLGGLLALRAWRSSVPAETADHAPMTSAGRRRLALVLGLCLGFDLLLVGHGLPFWLAAALFVGAAILMLRPREDATGRRLATPRAVVTTALIGLGAGGAVTLVFQTLFLVRLP